MSRSQTRIRKHLVVTACRDDCLSIFSSCCLFLREVSSVVLATVTNDCSRKSGPLLSTGYDNRSCTLCSIPFVEFCSCGKMFLLVELRPSTSISTLSMFISEMTWIKNDAILDVA